MTRGYTSAQIRASEAPHLASGEPLMRRAAHGLAGRILDLLAGRPDTTAPARVLVLVGSGDNGGDALFAAAELAESGCEVRVIGTGSRMHEEGRAAVVAAAGASAFVDPADDASVAVLEVVDHGVDDDGVDDDGVDDHGVDIVVDGILGIAPSDGSSSPALRGRAHDVVSTLLSVAHLPPVVAVDIPSGVDSDTGAAPDGVVLPATVTVTFGGVKAGLLRGEGMRLAGEVVVIDIGTGGQLAAMEPEVDLP